MNFGSESGTNLAACIASTLVATILNDVNNDNKPAEALWPVFSSEIETMVSCSFGASKATAAAIAASQITSKTLILEALVRIKLGPQYVAWPDIVALAESALAESHLILNAN
jgi:hypothetical protein